MISDICYASAGDNVTATLAGNPHRLDWNRASGDVYLDDFPRPLAQHLSEHLFHVEAATLFGRLDSVEHDDTPLPHLPKPMRRVGGYRGAGWMRACSCGHYRTPWCPTELEANQRMGAHLAAAIPQQRSNAS